MPVRSFMTLAQSRIACCPFVSEYKLHKTYSAYRHMLRMRAPTSIRTCLGSSRSGAVLAATGQGRHWNNGSKAAGMKRVREA